MQLSFCWGSLVHGCWVSAWVLRFSLVIEARVSAPIRLYFFWLLTIADRRMVRRAMECDLGGLWYSLNQGYCGCSPWSVVGAGRVHWLKCYDAVIMQWQGCRHLGLVDCIQLVGKDPVQYGRGGVPSPMSGSPHMLKPIQFSYPISRSVSRKTPQKTEAHMKQFKVP